MWPRSASRQELARRLTRPLRIQGSDLQLKDGSRIAVVGGGPAGSFFAYFLLRLADSIDLKLDLEIYEPRYFNHFGPAGCNHCGGIISESLVQLLATDGIRLPPTVVQRGIEAYMLHTDEASVRIETPLHEKRIAAVYRGGGPKGLSAAEWESFDNFLLKLAKEKGANIRRELVRDVTWRDGRPLLSIPGGSAEPYDLVVIASGVNSHLLDSIEALDLGYRRPKTTSAFISEFHLGRETIQKTLGSAMHVFLLDLPRLEFAALIPKQEFITMCLLGDDIDDALVRSFLDAPEVKRMLPRGSEGSYMASCHCFPRINIDGSRQPFADRLLFIGDSGVTRLYKDGIGAAYRTAKAAANAAVLGGIAASDFRHHFWPACRKIAADNSIGRIVFWASGLIQRAPFSRRAMVRMTAHEQQTEGIPRDMSTALWDVFTGSAPYREIFLRTLRPGFIVRLCWNLVAAILPLGQRPLSAERADER